VPLLELDDDVIIESETIVRRIAAECDPSSTLLPGGESELWHTNRFIQLWTSTVVARYYDVLTSPNEQHVNYNTAMFIEALREAENALWEPRLAWS